MPLRLTVSLRIERNTHSLFDAQEVAQWKPELRCKEQPLVGDQRVWYSMMLSHTANNNFG